MKVWKSKGMLAAALMCATVVVSGQGSMRAPNYDPAKEVTIQGSVEEVITAQRGAMTGVHLKLKAADKTFDVRLGPAWFLQEKRFIFSAGDQIEVTGATMSLKAGEIIIAREVKKGDSVLVLRDANGFPLWSGAKRRQTG